MYICDPINNSQVRHFYFLFYKFYIEQITCPKGHTYVVKWHREYKQTSFYCTSLYCILQILHLLQIESLWQPASFCFSNTICLLCISVSHFINSYSISKILYYYICYGDLLSVILDVTMVIVLWLHEP